MCRWIAYIGQPIYMDTLVTRPAHSLVAQSLNTKMRFRPDGSILSINGDGFGIGWYNTLPNPGLYKVSEPAWSNENLHEICTQTQAHIFMAHIREATTGEVQRSNSHPFKYKNWIFQHNGRINGFEHIRRELEFDISKELYPLVKGNTDSEVFFFLALTNGLETDPKSAIEKTIKRIRQACNDQNIPFEMTLSIAFSNGEFLYTSRFAAGIEANSQYYSTHAECMQQISDDYTKIPTNGVVVVSEPLDHTYELWKETPKSSFAIIRDGAIDLQSLNVE